MLAQRVRAVAALAGGTVAERGVYPGWQYKRESQFRDTLLAAYKDLTGKDGVVEATHGGLECGIADGEDPRSGRGVHGAGAARCTLRAGAAKRALHGAHL